MNVLDTSALIEIARNSVLGGAIVRNLGKTPVAITAVTCYEFSIGIRNDREEDFLALFDSIELDRQASIESSRIFKELKKKGITLDTSDLLIAGICKNRGATLHTLDADFKKIPGLHVKHY